MSIQNVVQQTGKAAHKILGKHGLSSSALSVSYIASATATRDRVDAILHTVEIYLFLRPTESRPVSRSLRSLPNMFKGVGDTPEKAAEHALAGLDVELSMYFARR